MKKKGFTLIELLAVIVILAIIALITVPVVIKIINNSKKGAAEDSAYGVVEAAKLFWMSNQMDFMNNNEEVTFTCKENKTCTTVMSGSSNTSLELTGTKPTGGTVKIKNGAITVTNLKFGEYYCNKTKLEEKIVCGTSEVEAEPEDLTYIVSFETDGGTIMLPKVVEPGETLGSVSNPRKIGYTFIGWYDESNNEVTASTPITSDITLYAQYEIKNVTVTFNSDGGSSVDSITFQEGSKINPLPETTKDKYNFLGWFNGTEQLTTTKMIMNDTTYTARWEARTVTVTFNSDGGTSVSSQTFNEGGTISSIPTSTKLGYTFNGWYDSNNQLLTTSTVINESKTYTAHWNVKNYTVTFNSDGGSAVASQQVQEGSTISTLPTTTKSGSEFLGWFDSGNNQLSTSTQIMDDITYTAHWRETHVTVSFNSNGGSSVADISVEMGGTIQNIPTTTKADSEFLGWYDSNDNKLTPSTVINAAKTYTAHWDSVSYARAGTLVYYDPKEDTLCDETHRESETCYEWRIINENSTTVTMQMNKDFIQTAWQSSNKTVDGPVTLFTNLVAATTDWKDELLLNYEYDTSSMGTYAYGKLSCTNGNCYLKNAATPFATGVKARVITKQEFDNITNKSVFFDNIACTSAVCDRYFSLTPKGTSSNIAYVADKKVSTTSLTTNNGEVKSTARKYARPVITVPKSELN